MSADGKQIRGGEGQRSKNSFGAVEGGEVGAATMRRRMVWLNWLGYGRLGLGNTVNNLAMGSSKPAPSRTSVSPVKRRRSARHVEVTTPVTEEGTPPSLFMQILHLCLHGIHPTEDTS